jgi:hypothetical protein
MMKDKMKASGKAKMGMASYQKGGKVMPAKGKHKMPDGSMMKGEKHMKGYRKGGMVKGC